MIFDTDVLIWVQRGNRKAAALVEEEEERQISILSYMELLQGARHTREHRQIKDFIRDFQFRILPLTENVGYRAAVYIEEYSLSHGLRAGDALVAATATENDLTLCSGNQRHFKPIRDLTLKAFRP